jgi:hypothetical protein
MIRAKEIQTLVGQQAYGFYKLWLEKQKRKCPSIEVFCTSAYYGSFVSFARWVKETGIADPERYVTLMVEQKLAPALWRRNEPYQIYLDYMNKLAPPIEQATRTIETIMTLAEGFGCEYGEVFAKLPVGQVVELIQQRRFSPWLLFCSKSFKSWVSELHHVDRSFLMSSIGVDWWAIMLERDPETVRYLKQIAEELGI